MSKKICFHSWNYLKTKYVGDKYFYVRKCSQCKEKEYGVMVQYIAWKTAKERGIKQ